MEKELLEVTDPVFGKVQPQAPSGELKAALDRAHDAMFSRTVARDLGDRPNVTRRNGKVYNALGLETTEEHSRISAEWQAKCRPLPDLVKAEGELANRKFDVRDYPVNHLKVDAYGGEFHVNHGVQAGARITRRGLETLGDLLGCPEQYMQRLLGWEMDDLAKRNINDLVDRRWQDDPEGTVTARFIDGHKDQAGPHLRCVASANYGILNNVDALEILTEAFGEGKVLASHMHTDENRIWGNLFPEDRMVTMRGDSDYGVGIAFRNGECLESAFAIHPFLYRTICCNGTIWGKRDGVEMVLAQRHVGTISMEDVTRRATAAIGAAMGRAEDLLALFEMTRDAKVTLPGAMVTYLARANELSKPQAQTWAMAWMKEQDDTGFGVVNALTLAAQQFTGAQREQMETLAGDLIAPSLAAKKDVVLSRWSNWDGMARQLAEEQPKLVQQYALWS